MATATPLQHKIQPVDEKELTCLTEDFFDAAEEQLAKMSPQERKGAIDSIHATAEKLRVEG
jgi:hypothetical protein